MACWDSISRVNSWDYYAKFSVHEFTTRRLRTNAIKWRGNVVRFANPRIESQRQFLPAKFRFWIWLSQGAGAWDKRDCARMLSMRQAKPSQVFAMRESATITSRGPRRGLGPTILAFVDSRTMRRLARDPGWLRRSHLD